jgi:[ribosomal protein S18]-alanine N-acetyltransferase
MSAVLKDAPRLLVMSQDDLDEVLEIENALYTHPWTRGNFSDSLRAAYDCRTWRLDDWLLGYFILMVAAGEAHLLNLSIAGRHQRSGARSLFLEVRPSNAAAQALYARFAFRRVGVRRGYYPARFGREDALVYTVEL